MYQNNGVVFNAFGRPRNFRGWIDVIDENRNTYDDYSQKIAAEKASEKVRGAVERRVPSHEIQGTAGDILRLVLYKLYKRYFKNRDPHIDFMSTVHDEINYTIDKEVTVPYVRELEQIMTFDTLDKTLPITTSTDIGFTYGNMFPFVWEDDTKQVLIPKRVHHA
jgi:DNA polymerase I-like protein with 3'-5' exonuclease and polymerase domains